MEPYEIEARKAAVRFICIALAVQLVLCLFWSTSALGALFPLYVRAAADKVTVGDNSYTEYYPVRRRTSGADLQLIVIGVDFTYRESGELLLDLITSLKNDVNIGAILVDGDGGSAASAAVISAADEEVRAEAMHALSAEAESGYISFLEKLSLMKNSYPPQRQFIGIGCTAEENAEAALMDAAAAAYDDTGRPVLLIVDTDMLDTGAPLRAAAEKMHGSAACIQCRYAEKWHIFGEKSPQILIVDSDELWFYDDLYANAARSADGRAPDMLYSEMYSTDVSFLLYDCTADG